MKSMRTASKKPKKKTLANQSVDEFMSGDFDTDSDDLSSEASFGQHASKKSAQLQSKQNVKGSKETSEKTKQSKNQKLNETPSKKKDQKIKQNSSKKEQKLSQKSSEKKDQKLSQKSTEKKGKKNSLHDLKNTDPEFYKFLQKEDQDLLDDDDDDDDDEDEFEEEDSDAVEDTAMEDPSKKRKDKQVAAAKKAFEKDILEMSSGSEDSDEEESNEGGIFQPPQKLEVDSDDEDFSAGEESDDSGENRPTRKKQTKLITAAMVKEWTKQLQEAPGVDVLREVFAALAAAAQHAGIAGELAQTYHVEGSKVFNIVMRMCLTEMVPALEKLLKVKSLSDQPQLFSHKNKKWKNLKGAIKNYCALMLQVCGELSEAGMVNVVLRHIHKLVVCFAGFPKLTKVFLKRLVALWSGGEETTRVLAFLCINKLVRLLPDTALEPTLKQMYMAYVNNCKFVSPSSLPLINFMQRSLVEVLLVQESLAYQHAFLYIRQLAIHLRNAITLKKKEMCQAVYNWQYVLSLGLWSHMLTTAHPSATLQPLIYPLIQVIIGTVRLLPTARYYPLRFHCVRYLTALSGTTNTFVPVVPFLLEVLEMTDFNKKQKASSTKNLSLGTILKFSKPQLQEKIFKDAVLEQLCELLLDYLNSQSHTAAFPELIVPLVIQLKDFLRVCKVAALCKQVKDVLQKAEENAKVIETRRRGCAFNLADPKAVELWESKNKEDGTPLSKFYVSWRKLRDRQLQKDIAGGDTTKLSAAERIPKIILPKGPKKASEEERAEFAGLFGDSDDEDNEDDSIRFLPKGEKAKKQDPTELDSDEEDYSDFDSDDLEQLAQSASEDEGNSDDDDGDDDDDDEDSESQEAEESRTSGKRKSASVGKISKAKRGRVEVENDGGDIVQEFNLSDFDSD